MKFVSVTSRTYWPRYGPGRISCLALMRSATRNAHAHVMPRAMGANNVRVHEE